MELKPHQVHSQKSNLVVDYINNYRPIASVPFLSKIVETVVANQLQAVLEKMIKHISSVTFHWLPVSFCASCKVMMLTYNVLNGLGPQYLAEHLFPMRYVHLTLSSQAGQLRTLIPREAKNWAFMVVTPYLWNNLPPEICLTLSLGN